MVNKVEVPDTGRRCKAHPIAATRTALCCAKASLIRQLRAFGQGKLAQWYRLVNYILTPPTRKARRNIE